jgi:hypothetical protein
MENLVLERVAPDRTVVKACIRIADAFASARKYQWYRHVGIHLEAGQEAGFAGDLTHDQMLRLSALIGLYKSLELYFNEPIAGEWVKLPNRGPEFDGARPVDAMIAGGLPKILRVRSYVDALRGGV